MIRAVFAISLVVLLLGCNGSSSKNRFFTGVWDIRYNMSIDECQIVLPGVPGFVDQHSIIEDDGLIELSTQSNLVESDTTSLGEDGSFTVRQQVEGDLFGDGSFCMLENSIHYSNLDHNTASSLFVQEVNCGDGFGCRSEGVGQAQRQENS